MDSIRTVLITQARTGSTRLPGKVLLKINDKELLQIHLDRLKSCTKVDKIMVATTNQAQDDVIENLCKKWRIDVSRGSEKDVLDRFYQAVAYIRPEWIVRVTSDCPLIDAGVIDECVNLCISKKSDYLCTAESFPDGLDVEVFPFILLKEANIKAKKNYEREHVTPWIKEYAKSNKSYSEYYCNPGYTDIRMTVDEQSDFEAIIKLVNFFGIYENWHVYADFILSCPQFFANQHIQRNEGILKSIRDENSQIL